MGPLKTWTGCCHLLSFFFSNMHSVPHQTAGKSSGREVRLACECWSRKLVDLGKRGKGHRRRLWACDGQRRLQEFWQWSFSSCSTQSWLESRPVLTSLTKLSDQLHTLPFLCFHMHNFSTPASSFQRWEKSRFVEPEVVNWAVIKDSFHIRLVLNLGLKSKMFKGFFFVQIRNKMKCKYFFICPGFKN